MDRLGRMDRRKFLSLGAAAGTTAAFVPRSAWSAPCGEMSHALSLATTYQPLEAHIANDAAPPADARR